MRMKFFAVTALFTAGVIAGPLKPRAAVCTGLEGNPQCCATDVLGIADLDCQTPPSSPTDVQDFTAICAAGGQRARCCALPVLGQGIICTQPV